MTIRVEVAGRTHIGLVRRRNEDSIYVGGSLVAVADGLGGHVAGDVASATVIGALQSHDRLVDPTDLSSALGQAVSAANEALRRKIAAEPALLGMGSTLVAMLRSGSTVALANVGDSRAYLLRAVGPGAGVTLQLTEDHTYKNLVADAASVPELPERLTRWIDGRADGRSPDITVRDLYPGDRFLLCSDGLSSYVPYNFVDTALRSSDGPDETADRLITLAIDQGGLDNITVIVGDVQAA